MFKVLTALFLVTTLIFGFGAYLFFWDSETQQQQLDCAHELIMIFSTVAGDEESGRDIDILHSLLRFDGFEFTKISNNALKSECTLVSYSDAGDILEVHSEIGMIGPSEIPILIGL